MWKAIKLMLGLLLLSAVGLGYGKFNEITREMKEDVHYVYISFSFPGDSIKTVIIKKTPASKCEKWRSEYFEAANEQCVGCTVLANDCREDIPDALLKAFEQKHTVLPYIYKPYKYPEVIGYLGLPNGAFSKLCENEKNSLQTATCYE